MAQNINPKDLYESPDLTLFCVPKDKDVECQVLERKAIREPKEIARALSAFANAQGGLLIEGVGPNGVLQGVNNLGEDCIEKILGGVRMVDTYVHHRFFPITKVDGSQDRLLLMYVEAITDRVVFRSDHKAFIRRGHSSDELLPQEILQLMQQRANKPAEDRAIVLYDEKILDQEVFRWLLDKASEELNPQQAPLDLLRNLSLVIDKDGQSYLTAAGYLLLAMNPRQLIPGAYVRFLKYEGTEQKVGSQQNLVKDETFWGPVPKIVLRLRDFLPSQLREFTYLGPDGKFRTESEYPNDAWDEAIVNAIFHRSYGDGFREEPVFVRLFDDRLEVISPGPFPEGIGPGKFRHKPRNPHLMTTMRYFRKVQMIGEGTRRMYQEMTDLGLPPPEFSEPGNAAVQVVIRNDIERRKVKRGLHEPQVTTQFANLFQLIIKAPPSVGQPVPDELVTPPSFGDIKNALVQALKEKGWAVDSFTLDTAVDFRQEQVYEPLRQARLVGLYPGFRFRVMSYDSTFYLALDHTVEARNMATLDKVLALCPYIDQHVLRKGFVRSSSGQWFPCRIRNITEKNQIVVAVRRVDGEHEETYPPSSVLPTLKTGHLIDLLNRAGIKFDLFRELKKLSLNLVDNAPRERAKKTRQIADQIANTVFPLKIRAFEVNLSTEPVRLSPPQFQRRSDLKETEPVFYRDVPNPVIVDGLTKQGAYGRPQQGQELSLYALCTRQAWPQLEALIEQIKKGSYQYHGFERTFGMRFGIPIALLTDKFEQYVDKLKEVIPTLKPGSFFIVYAPEEGYSRADYHAPYYQVKYLLLQSGFPSQMVDSDTLRDMRYKDLNLALDVFSKAGFTPWVLAEGMPDADLFVGLSYSSIPIDGKTERLIAYANIFDQLGRWRYYRGNSQVVPFKERHRLFRDLLKDAVTEYQATQRVRHLHVHIPFRLSHDIRIEISKGVWDVAPNAQVSFVYINQHALVRAYDEKPEGDGSLPRGTYIITGTNQFWIATTGANILGEKVRGTPRILEINVNRLNSKTRLDLRLYAQHILSLTKLNWASSRPFCHEPITIKFASDIAYLMNVFIHAQGDFKLHPNLEHTPWFL